MDRLVVIILVMLPFMAFGQETESMERMVLGAPINSIYTETRPFISADGQQLYLSRRESPENVGGHKDFMDIYRAQRQADGSWSELENLGSSVNTKGPDALSCIGEDGKTLYIFNTARKPKFPLFKTSEQTNGTFSEPEPVRVDKYYNAADYMDFYVSEKFGVMILAIERKDSRGDQDLYISERKPDGTYGEPQHMGATINSGKAEFAPILGPKGNRIYFASYGFGGQGGSDIFFAERIGDSWTSWGRPQNLGNGLNSRGQEIYFSFTGDFEHIYIESWDRAHEDRDIIKVGLPENLRPELPEVVQPEPEPIVVASAQEASPPTLAPEIEAAIDQAAADQKEQRERNREALAASPALTTEVVPMEEVQEIEPKEITPTLQDLDSTEPIAKAPEEERSLSAGSSSATTLALYNSQWIREREHIDHRELKYLRNMYFELGSTSVDDSYDEHLNRIVEYLNQYPELTLIIEGHTDMVGSDRVNQELSEARAEATANYLIEQGIAEDRIQVKGLSDAYPLASNDDEQDGRELNRRVEISLIPAGI